MKVDVTVKIGGEAGQGIQTVGQLLALTCKHCDLYALGTNDFESRIRGGHNFFQLRISDRPVFAPSEKIHILVAMDDKTFGLHGSEVLPDGISILETDPENSSAKSIIAPFNELAKKAGSPITANTVAAGMVLQLLGCELQIFETVLKKQFEAKDNTVIEQNLHAARIGYKQAENINLACAFKWKNDTSSKMLVEGSQTMAIGALAADCRFAAFYPMSPATGTMMHLSACQGRFPVVVEQAEDEIAAVNMIVGASFAGVRSITATSGGGFCLMTEGLGLSGITEIPIVIINAQRPGPATGLPTRTAQGDLLFVINASQDEFPRFVFAPGYPEEAYSCIIRAFELTEKYQVPAIVLVDQYFNDSLYVMDRSFKVSSKLKRFIDDDSSIPSPSDYKRYEITDSGISPRTLPGRGKTLVTVCGNEHNEQGRITEEISEVKYMFEKRAKKVSGMVADINPPNVDHPDSSLLLLCWGSTAGAVKEAVEVLREDGIDAGSVHFVDIFPFPAETVQKILRNAKDIIVIEQNISGQFADYLRQQTGIVSKKVVKYDGRPFYPYEIIKQVKEILR